MTILIDGKKVSAAVLEDIRSEIVALQKAGKRLPGLAVVLVGENPASQAYVGSKKRTCLDLGMVSFDYHLPADTSESDLLSLVETLNADEKVDGILVQLPLPSHINESKVLTLISPDKDVDGFHPFNVGKLLQGLPTFKSCTPYGVMEMLRHYQIDPAGKHVVIVGRSNIVGKPLAAMLIQREEGANATVTICHSQTPNLAEFTQKADIVIAAIGRAHFITADMVKSGAVVIDVGINKLDDPSLPRGYRLVGDVDFEAVSKKASAITPVPGGVGLMTIAMLMKNTLGAYQSRRK